MEKNKLERINFLAKKSKTEALSEEEIKEQKLLRKEYIDGFKIGFQSTIESIVIVDENGNRRKLEPKKK